MKSWLARAAAGTVARGRGRTRVARVARWSRWFPRTGPVDGRAFQGPDEPYPRHWRRFPDPWPPVSATDDAVRRRMQDALDRLPPTWRAVVRQRDVAGRDPQQVADDLGISVEQQRRILNQARAALREQLAGLLTRWDPR